MKRKYGMTPAMFSAYIRACFFAKIDPKRITQTIGTAKASAGYHAKDGEVTVDGISYDYCAAVDISIRKLDEADIKRLLIELAKQGFVGWYRYKGSFKNNRHIHCVYVGLPMKAQLRSQVKDFLNDRTGLVGHAKETFWTAPPEIDHPLRLAFLEANPSAK